MNKKDKEINELKRENVYMADMLDTLIQQTNSWNESVANIIGRPVNTGIDINSANKPFTKKIDQLKQRVKDLELELEEYRCTARLIWESEKRVIKIWRKENKNRKLSIPGHESLCLWLIKRVRMLSKKLKRKNK